MSEATWVVPPVYEAVIHGYDAVEITARKVHLICRGKRVLSSTYKVTDKLAGKSFGELVDFVRGKQ